MRFQQRWEKPVSALLVLFALALCANIVFVNLTSKSLNLWDESRFASNACEMLERGNWLVLYFGGKPDLWNLKPPFAVWLQALSFSMLGVNELAVRLPSALGAFFLCCSLIVYGKILLGNLQTGVISSLILVGTPGFVAFHAARSGDCDSVFTLFSTVYSLAFFAYLEEPEQRKKTIHCSVFLCSLALAIFTKGVVALFFLPALILYVTFERRAKELFRDNFFRIGGLAVLILMLAYLVAREYLLPGYITSIWTKDISHRFMTSVEVPSEPFLYYMRQMKDGDFTPWVWIALAGGFLTVFFANAHARKLAQYLSLLICIFFLIISFAHTKHEWYEIPLYPLLSILCGLCLSKVISQVRAPYFRPRPVLSCLLLLLLANRYVHQYSRMNSAISIEAHNKYEESQYSTSDFLSQSIRLKRNLRGFKFVTSHLTSPTNFYLCALRRTGTTIQTVAREQVQVGDNLIVEGASAINVLERQFFFMNFYRSGETAIVSVLGKRTV